MTSAGIPSLTYGTDTIGVADSVLRRMRVMAAAAVSAPGAGKQLDAVLWLADVAGHRADPAFAAHELPVVVLARAVWERWLHCQHH